MNIERVREILGQKSRAMCLALDDVTETAGETESYWVDSRDETSVAVYAVTPGILHRLHGPVDPPAAKTDPGRPRASRCEYEVLPITRAFRSSITIRCTTAAEGPVARHWTFLIGDAPVLVDEATEGGHEFARALAGEIVRHRTPDSI